MASLAANVPQGSDPEYLRYSRPIGSIEGNKAGALIGKGVAEGIDIAAKTGEEFVSQTAKNEAYKAGQAQEEQWNQVIDPIYRQVVLGENTNSATTPSQPLQFAENQPSLVKDNKDLPPQITDGAKQAAAINERFKNGKITQTDYDSSIDVIAKNLNSRFPAWTNEISQGLQKATGRDHAGQFISDKIRDINTVLQQLGQNRDKYMNHLLSNGDKFADPRVPRMLLQGLLDGTKSGPEVMQKVWEAQGIDVQNNRARAAYEQHKEAKDLTAEKATDLATQIIQGETNRFQNEFEITSNGMTPAKMQAKFQDWINNPNDPEATQALGNYANAIPMWAERMRKQLMPMASALGGIDKVNALVTQATEGQRQILQSAIGDPSKAGSAMYASKIYADSVGRQQEGTLAKDALGRQLMAIKLMQEKAPALASQIYNNFIANEKELPTGIANLAKQFKLSAISQPPGTPGAVNLADAVDAIRQRGGPYAAKTADDYVNFLGNIKSKDIDPAMAKNLAYAYYDPKNIGVVGQWTGDTMDSRGQPRSGQVSVLQRMGDKDVLAKIKSLGDPTLNGHVKNFMENAFTYSVFPTLMKDSEAMVKAAGDRLGYDDEHQRFYLTPKVGNSISSSPFVRNTVNKLNFALETMNNMADFVGAKDKNGYLIGLLTAGNPNLFSREVPGFPGEINKAIQNQALARAKEEEDKKAKQKALQNP